MGAQPGSPRIAEGQDITVTVPATTANLGPGFDCLGLALGLRDTLRVRTVEPGEVKVLVEGEGAATLPDDESHLVARTILERWDQLGVRPAGLLIEARNVIPHGRGLGSSAAAIVSALSAADALVPSAARAGLGRDAVFAEAARREGHPDNVAPAVYGGLTLSWEEGEQVRTTSLDVDDALRLVVAVPDVELSTRRARGLLPATVPHAVAAANGARVGLLVKALAGDSSLLMAGTTDFLHQDFRAEAMPYSAALIGALRAAGHAAVVSGAGPTVLVVAAGSDEAARAVELIEQGVPGGSSAGDAEGTPVAWRVWMPGVDTSGAKVEVH